MQFLHRRQTIQNLQNPDAGHASITKIAMRPSVPRQCHFPIHPHPAPRPDSRSEQAHILPSQNRPGAPSDRHLLQPVHAGTAQSPHPVVRSAVLSCQHPPFPTRKAVAGLLSMTTDSGGASPAILAGEVAPHHRRVTPSPTPCTGAAVPHAPAWWPRARARDRVPPAPG